MAQKRNLRNLKVPLLCSRILKVNMNYFQETGSQAKGEGRPPPPHNGDSAILSTKFVRAAGTSIGVLFWKC